MVLPALFHQIVYKLQELLVRRIGQRSHVVDAEAPEALLELCTVVAEQFQVFEPFEVPKPPQLGVVVDDDVKGDHLGGVELLTGSGDSCNGLCVELEVLGENKRVLSQLGNRHGCTCTVLYK